MPSLKYLFTELVCALAGGPEAEASGAKAAHVCMVRISYFGSDDLALKLMVNLAERYC